MRVHFLTVTLLATLALAACVRPQSPLVMVAPGVQPLAPQVLQYSVPVSETVPIAVGPAPVSMVERGPEVGDQPYTLDSGDRLRIVVFGQQGLTNTYLVDASGHIALPLIGAVAARGVTPQQLAQDITAGLRRGYMRDPHVTVEVIAYRPFFILGEVNTPGQYPYVAHMSVETAVAIAGGFSPRASKGEVSVSRPAQGQIFKFNAPVTFQIRPGDTIRIKERWF